MLAARDDRDDLRSAERLPWDDGLIGEPEAEPAALSITKRKSKKPSGVLLTPELTQGPYHVKGEVLRKNVTEGQRGIPLHLKIDFIDMATCKPVPHVYADVWSANATGYYSGYTLLDPYFGCFGWNSVNGDPPTTPQSVTIPPPPATTNPTNLADQANFTGYNIPTTDDSNFLRGVWKADSKGRLNMFTIIPGHYPCRTVHVHLKAVTKGRVLRNNTFQEIHTVHTGQFFFSEAFTRTFEKVEPYASNTFPRYNNSMDYYYIYAAAAQEGSPADLDIAYVDRRDIRKGVIGRASVGLNMSYTSFDVSEQTWKGHA